ncbi:PadR family transcriptional regulator [Lapillicoccus jejuensis]|uniref:DNA-binding PadR family transcriptional regulator n=1 Tax=Lapillicoccus jejuensis TaxID=402171 RepID=A0A542DYK8_9MICO|nr:PadR family transcriptional regulator [Lapillicoccus jejuensis]TQJ08183.1 DNA-binding PadR family transcriptional regulator [Lapillicoccus jejuensis]
MATSPTRLLLLGAVLIFEPVNAYQVRRELRSWGVDEWAHLNPGSIYSGLGTLARQGHLVQHALSEGGREVAVYTSTTQGRGEFGRLMEEAVTVVDLSAPLAFQTALTLMPLLDRATMRDLVRRRLERVDGWRRRVEEQAPPHGVVPPHVRVLVEHWERSARVERELAQGLLADIEAGRLAFAGEPDDWAPPQDDPGWQMASDRRRYVAALGLDGDEPGERP